MPISKKPSLSGAPVNSSVASLRRVLILSTLLGACGGQAHPGADFEPKHSSVAPSKKTAPVSTVLPYVIQPAPIVAMANTESPPQAEGVATEGSLDVFRRDIAAKDVDGSVKAEELRLQNNPELGDGRKFVIVGDSAANGMYQSFEKRPIFVGKDGMTTYAAWKNLVANQWKLRGKEKVIIYCGGNSILMGTKPETMKKHMFDMARMGDKAGVPDVIVGTQFPPDPRWVEAMGSEYARFKRKNKEFRRLLLEAYENGELPDSVRVVDLFAPFADENGMMKQQYVSRMSADYLHPWPAYKPALELMLRLEKNKADEEHEVYSD